jgi:hypothetical protein
MARISTHKASARANAKRWHRFDRRRQMMLRTLKRKGEVLIPDRMLTALQAAALPPDVSAYNMRLHELMRGA